MPRYRALVDLSYPADPAIIARLVAGENLPFKQRGELREVRAGEIVEDFPEVSAAGFLAKGKIELVDDAAPAPKRARKGGDVP